MFKQRHIDSDKNFSVFAYNWGLGTPWSLWGWALQGVSGVGHSRQFVGLGTAGSLRSLWGGALQGVSGVGHFSQSLGLGTPGSLWGWALQGSLGLGTPGSLGLDRTRRVSGEQKS